MQFRLEAFTRDREYEMLGDTEQQLAEALEFVASWRKHPLGTVSLQAPNGFEHIMYGDIVETRLAVTA